MKKKSFGFSDVFQVKKSFWRGLAIALPLAVFFYILTLLIGPLDKAGSFVIGLFLADKFIFPGAGLILILVIIYIVGRIEVHFAEREKNIWSFLKEKTIGKIPFFGFFFTSKNRNMISLEDIKRATPCKFWLSDTCAHYGLIIGEQSIRGDEPEIDVYRPNVPTLIPGDLFPVKKRYVIKLANSPNEILNKLASGGIIKPDEEIPIKWDDETDEEFNERVRLTPLEIAIKTITKELPIKNSQGAE